MWYFDQNGEFVGDEDRPSRDDMGWISATPRLPRVEEEIESDLANQDDRLEGLAEQSES